MFRGFRSVVCCHVGRTHPPPPQPPGGCCAPRRRVVGGCTAVCSWRATANAASTPRPWVLYCCLQLAHNPSSKSRTRFVQILLRDEQAEASEWNQWPQASREQGLQKSSWVTNRLRPLSEINGLKQVANRVCKNRPKWQTGWGLLVKSTASSKANPEWGTRDLA